jgi:5-methylcytosine-specific restriction protein B
VECGQITGTIPVLGDETGRENVRMASVAPIISAMPDALDDLTAVISKGLNEKSPNLLASVKALFGSRYRQNDWKPDGVRDRYAMGDEGVPFGALLHPDNPSSGAYGGFSLAWFPTTEGSVMTLVVGTRGLQPDESILTRPGHRRRVAALRRYLTRNGIDAWAKADPAAIAVKMPSQARQLLGDSFAGAYDRYGDVIYVAARVPASDLSKSRLVVQAFFDLYAFERGWKPLKAAQPEYEDFHGRLRADLFPNVEPKDVHRLLKQRRFVVLQGPPGTGKTRMTEIVKRDFFAARGETVQFHPAVTYEDFIVGLTPHVDKTELSFRVKKGWLLEAASKAASEPYLLVIDEINRADLGKVLGEAIYLFEAGEVGGPNARLLTLTHEVEKRRTFSFPENLYVLATMNTADRSIAGMDLAIRRRFSFVTLMPARQVLVEENCPESALEAFDWLTDVFVEFAPDEALTLMPGHSYFLAKTNDALRTRFRYELLPLIDEYLRQGFLAQAASELISVRDRIDDMSRES